MQIFTFIENRQEVDLNSINRNNDSISHGVGWYNGNSQYNIDGLIKGGVWENELYSSYVQYFRNGIIESVDNYFVRTNDDYSPESTYLIPIRRYEKNLNEKIIPNFLKILRENLLEPPIWIIINILNVRDFKAMIDSRYSRFYIDRRVNNKVKKNNIQLPIIIIDSFQEKLFPKMKPIFNFLWNLAGYDQTHSFDEEGNFIE